MSNRDESSFMDRILGALAPAANDVPTERQALEAFYRATNGDGWNLPFFEEHNWLSHKPLGDWYGVYTDNSGRVTSLELANNQLSGEIPPELGNLSELEALYLAQPLDRLHPPETARHSQQRPIILRIAQLPIAAAQALTR